MKHSNYTTHFDLTKPKKPLFDSVLHVLYVIACFAVFILIWTGL
jgi:hypothetical protein